MIKMKMTTGGINNNPAKYYSFLSEDEIEANVVKYHGHRIICPPSFRDQDVMIRAFYKNKCDFLYKKVEDYNHKTFIRMPPCYEGHSVRVIAYNMEKTKEIEKIMQRLRKDQVYSRLTDPDRNLNIGLNH